MEVGEIMLPGSLRQFDLDHRYPTVSAFHDQVDFTFACTIPGMRHPRRLGPLGIDPHRLATSDSRRAPRAVTIRPVPAWIGPPCGSTDPSTGLPAFCRQVDSEHTVALPPPGRLPVTPCARLP